ncbi:MAG: glycosyltransferase [Lachnospirales bacterium]
MENYEAFDKLAMILLQQVINNVTDATTQQTIQSLHNIYDESIDKKNFFAYLEERYKNENATALIIILEYLYLVTESETILEKELEVLEKYAKTEHLDFYYSLFLKWQNTLRIFVSQEKNLNYIRLRNLHTSLISRYKNLINFSLEYIPIEERNNDQIVIFITQISGEKHGPTRNLTDYAYTLQKKLGKKVFVVIAYDMPSRHTFITAYPYINYTEFNYSEELEGAQSHECLGETIPFYGTKLQEGNEQDTLEIIKYVHSLKPGLIYNMGGNNILADICGEFTTEVTLPFSNNFPITDAKYIILPRNLNAFDSEVQNFIENKGQEIIESVFVYKLDEAITLRKKEDFGFKEKNFVISIVGGRLAEEVTGTFVEKLNEYMSKNQDAVVLLVGTYDSFETKKRQFLHLDRINFIGFQNDLRGVLEAVDVYLNPPRKGGGTSGAEALAQGVPVVTLPFFDVGYTVGDYFTCEDMDKIFETLHRYYVDKDFYALQSKRGLEQVEKITNTEQVIKDILKVVLQS